MYLTSEMFTKRITKQVCMDIPVTKVLFLFNLPLMILLLSSRMFISIMDRLNLQ